MEEIVHDSKPKVYRELPCALSEDDLAYRGDHLAIDQGLVDSLEGEKKEAADGFNSRIKLARARMTRMAKEIRDRQEMRDVEIRELLVPSAGEVHTQRADTGEVIGTRPMSEHEKQRSLFPVELEVPAAVAGGEQEGASTTPRTILEGPDPLGMEDPVD